MSSDRRGRSGQLAEGALERARERVYALQRLLVLGTGDQEALDAALDAAVVEYRAAGAAAVRWREAAQPAGPAAEERFAGWLLDAARRRAGASPAA